MAESFLERMRKSSHLAGGNVAYIEALYETFLEDPNDVPEQWRGYFDKLPRVEGEVSGDMPHSTIVRHFEMLGRNRLKAQPEEVSTEVSSEHERKQVRVLELISAYRHRGHRRANLDPLGLWERDPAPELELVYHNLTQSDLDTVFHSGSGHFFEIGQAKLRDIVDSLETTYCGSVGAEYMFITDAAEQLWVRQRLESVHARPEFSAESKRMILERLTAAEGLEKYLHNKYPGTKRFGLEGAESLIPMLHEALQRTGSHGVVETVIGMAHRGRLNVLVNILGKHPGDLFDEFEGVLPETGRTGDVKYHQGFSSNVMTAGGEMHVALSFNPSHLEIVGPVVEGSVRARQDRRRDYGGNLVVPFVIHGDAAFAGQGVVMETFQMSQTRGFYTGGTIHIIINNQIGFTTHRIEDARSTEYCTEVAKMVRAPIFHVNGDDPEAVVYVAQLAVDYRMEFKKDVVIDLVCYRRRGHNEAEDPMKTQPIMYQAIHQHPTTRTVYADRLVAEGIVSQQEADDAAAGHRDTLDSGEHTALSLVQEPDAALFVDWSPYLGHEWTTPADTRVDRARLQDLAHRLDAVPEGFVLHRQVQRIVEDRHKMTAGAMPINWGYAEIMAYATLLDEGHPVRLTGQDVGIGTFSHRHASLYNQKDGKRFIPLNHLSDVTFDIYDSLLSEEAVLAFEYGYSTTTPNALVAWEAQFGDFANGAQVVIDQFVSSGETKWGRLCGLVMLLPHGYEGAGPEHSSARLERFLQLSAQHNMQVCLPTTPAQMFHMLRRQVIRPLRKPLVALTPKSLLRHKLAVSTLEDLADGSFHAVLGEVDDLDPQRIDRVVLCSGKVYYDLLATRREDGVENVAIIRMEQLYPFPEAELGEIIAPYANLNDVVWCQEEPMNQGAWYSSQHHMRRVILRHDDQIYLAYAGREGFAAPAGGYVATHIEGQRQLMHDALHG
ncbi:MAG: 2-oxoglutarate dehydrogenase E1 component [Gammaproteobacteria bacterium]|nr:2-oxoglutarate dehydrogenase E1 component [Gammaproteobacteria bacterium]